MDDAEANANLLNYQGNDGLRDIFLETFDEIGQ